jgi:hypothetical protein
MAAWTVKPTRTAMRSICYDSIDEIIPKQIQSAIDAIPNVGYKSYRASVLNPIAEDILKLGTVSKLDVTAIILKSNAWAAMIGLLATVSYTIGADKLAERIMNRLESGNYIPAGAADATIADDVDEATADVSGAAAGIVEDVKEALPDLPKAPDLSDPDGLKGMIGAVISAVLALVVIGGIAWVLWTFIIKDRLPAKYKSQLGDIEDPAKMLEKAKEGLEEKAGHIEQELTTAANNVEHRLDTVTANIDRMADKVEGRLDRSLERGDRMMDRMNNIQDRLNSQAQRGLDQAMKPLETMNNASLKMTEMGMENMRAGMAMQTATVEPYLEIAGKVLDMAESHPEATKIATTAATGAATGGAGAVGSIMEAAAPAIAASAAGAAQGAAPAAVKAAEEAEG